MATSGGAENRSDQSNEHADSSNAAEPWRLVPSSDLRAQTVSFQTVKGLKPDDYVQALEGQGYGDILSLQFASRGECHLTLGSQVSVNSIQANGFLLGNRHVFPSQFRSDRDTTIQIHIHDVPVWIKDSNISCVLSAYGKVVGNIRHGKRKLKSGAFMCTGVRFATFEPKRGMTLPRTHRTSE